MRQNRSPRADGAAYGLQVKVAGFDGSFVSVVVDLPDAAVTGLTKSHVLGLHSAIEPSREIKAFGRLNVRHGPNTEQIVCDLEMQTGPVAADFDLAYTKLNEKRVESAWIDLIFDAPADTTLVLADLTVSRRRRAQF